MNIICNDIIRVFQTEYLGVKVSLQEFHEMGQVVLVKQLIPLPYRK